MTRPQAAAPGAGPLVVLYEDRPHHAVGLKLAVLSLLRHAPDARVRVRVPGASAALTSWFSRLPSVQLDPRQVAGASGWDVKPRLLLEALEQAPEACWLDSDVLTCADPRPLLEAVTDDVLVATEETPWGQAQGGTHRTQAWGLPVGRSLPVTVNTGVMRVSRDHTQLLLEWADLLGDARYRSAQGRHWRERPLHLLGDQEVLTALLGSRRHAHVPVHLLAAGTSIAQCFGPAGYRPLDRVRSVLKNRHPTFVHAMGRKPWEVARPTGRDLRSPRSWYDWSHQRLSPYRALAGAYADRLDEPCPWLGPARSRVAAAVRELPLAVVDDAARALKAAVGLDRYEIVTAPAPAPAPDASGLTAAGTLA